MTDLEEFKKLTEEERAIIRSTAIEGRKKTEEKFWDIIEKIKKCNYDQEFIDSIEKDPDFKLRKGLKRVELCARVRGMWRCVDWRSLCDIRSIKTEEDYIADYLEECLPLFNEKTKLEKDKEKRAQIRKKMKHMRDISMDLRKVNTRKPRIR